MSVAFRAVGPVASQTLTGSVSTNMAVTYPATVQPGDICIMHVSAGGQWASSGPAAGWTEFGTGAGLGGTYTGDVRMYWRRATGGEAGTTILTPIGSYTTSIFYGYIAAFSGGVLNGNPISHFHDFGGVDQTLTVDTSAVRYPIASIRSQGATTWANESWPGLTGVVGAERVNNGNVLLYTATATGGTSSYFSVFGGSGSVQGVLFDLIPAVAPFAPTPTTPPTGSSIDRTITERFAWQFSAPDPYETQSQFDMQYRLTGTTTWSLISQQTPNPFVDLPAGTFPAGSYEWQVRAYGQLGAASPWSTSSFFTATNPTVGPVITAPTNNSTVGLSAAPVTWSAPVQEAFEVRRVADSAGGADTTTIYSDTGIVIDATTRTVTLPFLTNNRAEHIQVRVRANGLWSGWADARVTISYTQPHTPALTLLTEPAQGSILLTITDPTPTGSEPAVTAVDVFRSEGGGPLERIAAALPPSTPFRYWAAASNVEYAFQARAYGTNGTTKDSSVVTVADGGSTAGGTTTTTLPPGYEGGYNRGY